MEKITYKKSLSAKLILSQELIPYYQMIKDACNTHYRITTRMSFGKETISYGKVKIAMLKVVKNIHLYLALDPKDYQNTKYSFKDMSLTKQGEVYPMRVIIKGSRSLKYALELLEDAFHKAGANTFCIAEDINYQHLFYPRGFDVLLGEGLIKKNIKRIKDEKPMDSFEEEEEETLARVTVSAKLLYDAKGAAKKLYIITNLSSWDPSKAIPMKKQKDGSFLANFNVPKNTHLEFKICKEEAWENVEKGIWKEEIINHYYYVTEDIEVEDLIHNFRKD